MLVVDPGRNFAFSGFLGDANHVVLAAVLLAGKHINLITIDICGLYSCLITFLFSTATKHNSIFAQIRPKYFCRIEENIVPFVEKAHPFLVLSFKIRLATDDEIIRW